MFEKILLSVAFLVLMSRLHVHAQSTIAGQDTTNRVIITAVPFLGIAPDSRASGMGDVGVATSADANSVHWNNAKLAFIDDDLGFSVSYSPWLRKLINDMGLFYLSGYKKLDKVQAIGASLRFFDLGEIHLTDTKGAPQGTDDPSELALDFTYSRKLSEYLSIGGTGRFITSNLGRTISQGGGNGKTANSVAVDLGVYYTKDIFLNGKNANLSFGAHLSNIGQKITYTNEENEDFIPTNIRLGSALKLDLDLYNSITLAVDFNKLMVPTPWEPIYITDPNTGQSVPSGEFNGKDPDRNMLSGVFGSFGDAPDGASEEFSEITISAGAEYWYQDDFAVRTGYFRESEMKGDREYITVGLGLRLQTLGFDFSYLIPTKINNPLAETLRISILFNIDNTTDEI